MIRRGYLEKRNAVQQKLVPYIAAVIFMAVLTSVLIYAVAKDCYAADMEFAEFSEVSSYAGILVDGDDIIYTEDWLGTISGGTITADGMTGVTILADEANGIAITKENETDIFTIEDCFISVSAGEINQEAGYEAKAGVAVAVETGELWIKNSTIKSEDARSTPVYMFSTGTSLVVEDSTLITSSDEIWMPPFKLLYGGSRATLLMTSNDSWFYGSTIISNTWGAISQDKVDATTYVINSSGTSTDGGYATYLTYGMKLYGSELYAAQYGVFMCGTSNILTDTGAAALEDEDAMSKIPDYDVDTDAVSIVAAPFNAVVVHNSLATIDQVATGNFKNSILSTLTEDLPDTVTAMSYDDEYFLYGVNPTGTGETCGAAYFFNRNLYGSLVLVRSMNADFTFDNTETSTSNGVLLQSVVTYDPPSPCGHLEVGEGDEVSGITATFLNGEYDGDILHEDYQRTMTVTVGEDAILEGKVVSGTWQAWLDLWTEDALTAALTEDGYISEDGDSSGSEVFDNDQWVEDIQANLIVDGDEDYADTDNYGVDMTVAEDGSWVVTGTSTLSSLTIEDGGSVSVPDGYTMTVYINCDTSNSLSSYDYSDATELSGELTAGTYENVVIVVEEDTTADTTTNTITITSGDATVTGDIPTDSVFTYEEIGTDDADYITIEEILADDAYDNIGAFVVYDLDLTSATEGGDDGTVDLTSNVEVTMPVPSELSDSDEIAVFVLEDDGTLTQLTASVNDDGTITFSAPHFSTYVFAEVTSSDSATATGTTTATTTATTTTTTTATDTTSVNTGDASNVLVWISLSTCTLFVAGVGIFIYNRKKIVKTNI